MSKGVPAVEVRFLDGTTIEGKVMNFNIKRKVFHLMIDREAGQNTKPIMFSDVKTIHFLKEEEPNTEHYKLVKEGIEKSGSVAPVAYNLIVEFKDGEFLHGSAHKYSPDDEGFYIVPNNPETPYEKIYISQAAVKKVDCKRLVGDILIEQEKVTVDQLQEALRRQREQRQQKIGSLLKEQTSITDEQLEWSLEAQEEKPKKRLGELLIEAGYISGQQLENALRMQRERKIRRLGQILVELGYITPNDICIALSTQFEPPWVDLSKKEIDSQIVSILPEEEARQFLAVPIDTSDDRLVVAISDPQDPGIKKKLKSITGRGIELAIGYDEYIEYIINSVYGVE